MKWFFAILLTAGCWVISAEAQVDTLRFEEINSFSVADQIYNTYFQDINNDNLPEMIVCQANLIEVYDPLNSNHLWSSPPLGHNSITWQAQFGDLNGDGYPDLVAIDPSATDTSYIKIFDVIHDRLVWTSPNYYHLPKICAIGDRNSDGVNDIIILTRGSVNNNAPDTAWIDVYDGPSFQLSAHNDFSVLSEPYYDNDFYPGIQATRTENLSKAAVIDFPINGQSQPKIILFLTLTGYGCTWDGVYYVTMYKHGGNYRIFDPISLSDVNINGNGGVQSFSADENSQGGISLCSYTKYDCHTNIYDPYGGYNANYYHYTDYSEILASDGNLTSNTLMHSDNENQQWYSAGIVGEMDLANDGEEICYGIRDSLKVFSFPAAVRLWSIPLVQATENDYYLFHSESILGPPQLLCDGFPDFPLTVINGTTGQVSAIFPYDTLRWIPTFVDLNNDGDDEMVRLIWNSNQFKIYSVINAANAINDDIGQIPSQFKLYPAYPNPFNAQTTIQYDLIKDSPLNIGIYDILGQRIATLLNQKQPAGHYQVIWNARDVSSGIYFYKIQAGDYSETKKMVLMK